MDNLLCPNVLKKMFVFLIIWAVFEHVFQHTDSFCHSQFMYKSSEEQPAAPLRRFVLQRSNLPGFLLWQMTVHPMYII